MTSKMRKSSVVITSVRAFRDRGSMGNMGQIRAAMHKCHDLKHVDKLLSSLLINGRGPRGGWSHDVNEKKLRGENSKAPDGIEHPCTTNVTVLAKRVNNKRSPSPRLSNELQKRSYSIFIFAAVVEERGPVAASIEAENQIA